jgi:hypothetical protein
MQLAAGQVTGLLPAALIGTNHYKLPCSAPLYYACNRQNGRRFEPPIDPRGICRSRTIACNVVFRCLLSEPAV